MPLITLRNVSKTYPPARRGEEPVTALRDINLEIEAGEIYGIIGYSGAGKSTLVRLINALETATSGDITVDGRQVTGVPERQLRQLRLDIGMIFQQFNLFNSKTVRNNVAYPLRVAGRSRAEIAARTAELLDFVGLTDKADNFPEQLSGGQKQRVGIARALAASPKILLADEATSALDPETTHEVLELLRRVNRELGITIVVITHEMDVIKNLATKVAVMDGGRIVEQGEVFEVFSNPREESSRKFVSTVVRGVPSAADLATLRNRHEGRMVTLSFRDGGASQSDVFVELAAAGVEFELVYGGINDISGRAFGHLTLALKGADQAIDGALAAVGHGIKVTELN
ncbi:methionine ABC transporter ATP-binding protein [Arthrobacter caoxuetaonis]|uniref:Methionine ABC transporter ATP-binding protein n=1 Tax=Arthrobacter caoxuetaonis TaxID=2886935 RepID=A0A9X1MI16_9MICC|nr:methionine ABC transporter ATP-binding protein [Arthrobacter caoxuetaonis]MCC3283541.1 methionine ABC transporter ATP-binding protein [Arthrobacter caoxuetaonis]MCC3298939.1 methionine ABC transporter ATP-binding protein [Arthrobacter caoxuetaonis]USQ58715.1 methionine ABC transporter ATP-binding protein [Arthrobacter caoxuetaonis]